MSFLTVKEVKVVLTATAKLSIIADANVMNFVVAIMTDIIITN